MPSGCLILCRALHLLPSVFPSIKIFFNKSVLRIRWPKYWSFSFSFSLSNEYSGLTSLRMTGLITLLSKGHSRVVLQHQNSEFSHLLFFSFVLSLLSVKLSSVHDYWENHCSVQSLSQALPASKYFPMSQLFAWGGQSTGVSVLASFLPKKSQGWSPSEWTSWISLQSKGLSRVFSHTTLQKHQFFRAQLSSQSNSHIHTWPLEKP